MKVNSAPVLPPASSLRVRPELKRKAPGGVQYTPGVRVAPPGEDHV